MPPPARHRGWKIDIVNVVFIFHIHVHIYVNYSVSCLHATLMVFVTEPGSCQASTLTEGRSERGERPKREREQGGVRAWEEKLWLCWNQWSEQMGDWASCSNHLMSPRGLIWKGREGEEGGGGGDSGECDARCPIFSLPPLPLPQGGLPCIIISSSL